MPLLVRPSLLLCLVLLGLHAHGQSINTPGAQSSAPAAAIEFSSESDLAARLMEMHAVAMSTQGAWLSHERVLVTPQPLPAVGTMLHIERITPVQGRGSHPPRFSLTAREPSGPRRWTATLLGRVEREVLTAARSIRRGEPIDCGHFQVSRKAAAPEPADAITPPCPLGSQATAGRYLAPGDVLRQADLQAEAAVTEMAPVMIRVAVGRVVLDAPGIALDSGKVGDRVRVRPGSSRHALLARVSGPRSVVVEDEVQP